MDETKNNFFHPEFLRSSAFLLSLVIVIFINPFLDESLAGRLVSSALVVLSTVGALVVMFAHREVIWFVLFTVVLGIVIEVLSLTFNNSFFTGMKYLSYSTIDTTFALILFYYLMKVQPLSMFEIGNAISIYLLAGLSFGYFYCFYAQNHPLAFSNLSGVAAENQFDLIYYSFITLTTTGYGDIHPLMKVPRVLSIFETIFGTFYIAVIIGRLVGLGYKKNTGKY
ncbi:MAG: potassium channel family protein [Bacteroidetes bacterium]|nr:potassium channel family protein [Bacteroidota bacterium]